MKKRGLMVAVGVLLLALSGCGAKQEERGEREQAVFEILEERELPPELLQIIRENREEEIRMTYQDGEYVYLVRGYGEQKTGGYSICVSECTEGEKDLCFRTQLLGPPGQEKLAEEPSYPYLVVRIGATEKEILID